MSASRRSALLPVVQIGLAGLCVLAVRGDEPVAGLSTVAGLLLVLILPGAALVSTFDRCFRPLERVALVLGTSISSVIGLSAGLALFGAELGRDNWSLGLGAITAVGSLIGLGRSLSTSLEDAIGRLLRRPSTPGVSVAAGSASRPRPAVLTSIGLGVLAILLLAGAGVVTGFSESDDRADAGFTELWVAHPPNSDANLVIGVENDEGRAQKYELEVSVAGESVRERSAISLSDGESKLINVAFPKAATGQDPAVVDLYRNGGSEPYREVELGPRD